MKQICIAAGGTGGHINAALSVGEAFNNYKVLYLSGTRYLDYQLFKNQNVIHFESKPLRTKNPFTLMYNIALNLFVFFRILMTYIVNRPKFVVGAGGYICGPTLLAAKILFIPIFIIEQNAVVGMTNKILSKFSDLIFTNFKNTRGLKNNNKIIRSGNPISSKINESTNSINEKIKILVFGGSLGATQINYAIKQYLRINSSREVEIIHQVGKDKLSNEIIKNKNIIYNQFEYIDNMDKKYEWANIIISRAGASTISELRKVKKPSILIPYPQATDNHQYYNACQLKEENGFYVDILDQKLEGIELSEKLQESIEKIILEKQFYKNDIEIEVATKIIKDEIENYVRC